MIDLSDGLATDARHLALRRRCGHRAGPRACPARRRVAEVAVALGSEPLTLALTGGEDFELCACLPAAAAARRSERSRVGRVVAGAADVRLGGETLRLAGYEHSL